MFASVGSTAMPVMRPLTLEFTLAGDWTARGEGPIAVHTVLLNSKMGASGAVSSSCGGMASHGSTGWRNSGGAVRSGGGCPAVDDAFDFASALSSCAATRFALRRSNDAEAAQSVMAVVLVNMRNSLVGGG